ncbi:MAG: choice-of-anchor D domain-containing protein [Myxococcota bacterium]
MGERIAQGLVRRTITGRQGGFTGAAGWLAVALAAVAGCGNEGGFTYLAPKIAVLPESLSFGEVVVDGEPGVASLYVTNEGADDLSVDVESTDAVYTVVGEPHLDLPPNESATIDLAFAPVALGQVDAAIVLNSNDVENPRVTVPVTGVGRVPYAPEIEIDPATVTWGGIDVGDDAFEAFVIRNVGDADLVLGSVTQTGAGTFSLDTDPSGATIPPGQGRNVIVTYRPVQPDGDSGAVVIPSNDADENPVEVALEANGGGDYQYPVAIIDCPGSVDLAGPELVDLDGSASYDPLGGPLTYAWSVVRRPAAADPARQVDPDDQAVGQLLLDAAGTWEIDLQVVSDAGVPSVPTKCVIDAVPIDALHVELSWNGATSDLDLHVAQDGGALYVVPDDVCTCNANPDWGVAGDLDDDPRLDADDISGFGPENVNLFRPADGTYLVRVHHFDDGDDGDVTANVSVFTDGALAWSGSKVLARNEVWEVGQVNWPDATFGVSTEPLWDAGGVRECR